MKFEHKATINAPIDQVWNFLMDLPSVAKCVPGVESVEALDNDRYRGTLKVKVGPISLNLQGDAYVTERDDAGHKATMRLDAADKRAGGAVKGIASMTATEIPGATPTTELQLDTDAQVMGRIGEFGQPIIRRKAEQTMNEFAENLRKAIQARAGSA
jgi:carbon monoxide dehydrogenase subunit G